MIEGDIRFRNARTINVRPDRSFVESDGTNWVTISSSPASGIRREVHNCTAFNNDSGAISVELAVYDGSTYWKQESYLSLPAGTGNNFLALSTFWVLKNGDSLVGKLGASPGTEAHFSAHFHDYLDDREP